MALHDTVTALADDWRARPRNSFQGVDRDKIRRVLRRLDMDGNGDLVDCVFSLLDDETQTWFAKAPKGSTISSGASVAHLASHIGILQRGKTKLDREGRDYWIKPLRDLGGIEAVTLKDEVFIAGHVTAKSPNSSYRLEHSFTEILRSPDGEWESMLDEWSRSDVARERMAFQAEMAEMSRKATDSGHAQLIQSSVTNYAPRFLPGYELLYVDDADGDRISNKERDKMAEAGVQLTLADAMPDALLWHPETDWLWVIEAVTSDGEVDSHKVKQLTALSERCGKAGIGFTTTYRTWKEAAARQGRHKNIAFETFIWIQEDPSKHLLVVG
ncbi:MULTISPECIES: BsuBI/PstI family type II restriction endonuclease [unclassified Yoonia]|uniref:BsuBI/PstI family type II restriction endonuclease n=1 Tax=unclassified Yoonia TaxID=2629118 RepID=UPI002AFEC7D5|nr:MULTISPECIES: BsuBI/PstI family type II restriction endonuclease [unclassified Yoonia]